jgi:hypothetical protein
MNFQSSNEVSRCFQKILNIVSLCIYNDVSLVDRDTGEYWKES